jgi:choline kinase
MTPEMTAIVLAAGRGTRLGDLAKDRPKAMVEFDGKPLLQWQIDAFRRAGIDRVVVIGGHHDETLPTHGVVRYRNDEYATTNMVETLMCARQELAGPVIVSYGDIVFEDRLLRAAMAAPVEIGVTVDMDWRPYWVARFGNAETDVEVLELGEGGRIARIGQPDPRPDQLHARYVGLLKFGESCVRTLTATYDRARAAYTGGPWRTSPSFERAYMTDMLQEVVDTGADVRAIGVERGWLEFDTADDMALANRWRDEGALAQFCRLGA